MLALALLPAMAPASDVPLDAGYVTNGAVNATAVDSDERTYLGGSFTEVGPRTGRGLKLTAASDQADLSLPDVNGIVNAVASDGSGGWFIGGSFTAVDGVSRSRLAHITSAGTVDPDWNPNANNTVDALAVSGGDVYAGGSFTTMNNGATTRNRLAKIPAAGAGTVDPDWNPNANNAVRALAVSGSDVYAGGSFTTMNNGATTRNRLAKIPAAGDGTVDPDWDPNANNAVRALAVSGGDVYAGGSFTTMNNGATTRNRLAKIPAAGDGTVDPGWNPNADSAVVALAVSGGDAYAGGFFTTMNGSTTRNRLAKIPAAGDGTVDPTWEPNAGGTVNALAVSGSDVYAGGEFTTMNGATTRNRLAKIPAAGAGTVDPDWDPNANEAVNALAVSGGDVYAGGAFTSANGTTRNRLARLNADGTVDPGWDPNANNAVRALAVSGSDVYAGGSFTTMNNGATTRNRLAKIPAAGAGTVDPDWNPNANNSVDALAVSGGDVYAGGSFTTMNNGATTRNRLAKIPAAGDGTVDPGWNPNADSSVVALAVSGGEVYAGGHFTTMNGATPRGRLAKIPAAGAGTVDPGWNPNPNDVVFALAASGGDVYAGGSFTGMNGTARNRLAKIPAGGAGTVDPDWDPNANNAVVALAVSEGDVYVGGHFTTMNGATTRNRLAKIRAGGDGTVDPGWNPNAGATVNALAVSGSRLAAGGIFTTMGTRSNQGAALFTVPFAVDDTATVAEDSSASPIDVLANDIEVTGVDSVDTIGTYGTVAIAPGDGSVEYTPDPGYCNDGPGVDLPPDAFTYTADGSTATVSVTVTCDATADTYNVRADGSGVACTQAHPCATVDDALAAHRVAPQLGDVIDIGTGTFVGNVGADEPEDDGLTIRGTLSGGTRQTTLRGTGAGVDDFGPAVLLGACSQSHVLLRDANVDTADAETYVEAVWLDGGSDLLNVHASSQPDSDAFGVVEVCEEGTSIEDSTIDARDTESAAGIVAGDGFELTDSRIRVGSGSGPGIVHSDLPGAAQRMTVTRSWIENESGSPNPGIISSGDLTIDSSLVTGGESFGLLYDGFGGGASWQVQNTTIDVGVPGAYDGGLADIFLPTAEGDDPIDVTVDSSILVEEVQSVPFGGGDPGPGTVTCSFTDVQAVSLDSTITDNCVIGSEGNTTTDPDEQFVGGDPFDWSLEAGAPAIDTGQPGTIDSGLSTTDLAGNPRRVPGTAASCPDGRRDMGAYESEAVSCIRQLDLITAGTGSGSVTSNPAGIDCGSDCAADYVVGTEVTLTAHPNANTDFIGFSGAGCSGAGLTCVVTMDQARSVTATFNLRQRTLTVTTSGTGSGRVTGPGISCGSGATDCAETVADGTQIALTATAGSDSSFAGFTGAGCSASPCSVTLDASRSVDAAFAQNPPAQRTLTVSTSGTGRGRVTGPGISCGNGATDCAETVAHGTEIELSAIPADGSTFGGFSGAGCSASPCTVAMDSERSVAATFTANPETRFAKSPKKPVKKAVFEIETTPVDAEIECRLDTRRFEECDSKVVFKKLRPGRHRFEAQAVLDGVADPTPAKKRFKIKR